MDPAMSTEHLAGSVYNVPAAVDQLRSNSLDHGCIIPIRHEANLLALGFVRRRQPQLTSPFTYLGLGQLPERKPG